MRTFKPILIASFLALTGLVISGCVIHQRPRGQTQTVREVSREEANAIAFDFVRSHGYAFAKLAGTLRDAGYWRVHLAQRMPTQSADLDVWVDVRTGYVSDSTLHRQGRTSGNWRPTGNGSGTYSSAPPPPRGQPAPAPGYAPAPAPARGSSTRPPPRGHAAQPAQPAQPAAQPAQPAGRPGAGAVPAAGTATRAPPRAGAAAGAVPTTGTATRATPRAGAAAAAVPSTGTATRATPRAGAAGTAVPATGTATQAGPRAGAMGRRVGSTPPTATQSAGRPPAARAQGLPMGKPDPRNAERDPHEGTHVGTKTKNRNAKLKKEKEDKKKKEEEAKNKKKTPSTVPGLRRGVPGR